MKWQSFLLATNIFVPNLLSKFCELHVRIAEYFAHCRRRNDGGCQSCRIDSSTKNSHTPLSGVFGQSFEHFLVCICDFTYFVIKKDDRTWRTFDNSSYKLLACCCPVLRVHCFDCSLGPYHTFNSLRQPPSENWKCSQILQLHAGPSRSYAIQVSCSAVGFLMSVFLSKTYGDVALT